MSKKRKKQVCKNCFYWQLNKDFDKTQAKRLKIKVGNCFHDPPVLIQLLIPTAIRKEGLFNVQEKLEQLQHRPILSEDSNICSKFKVKK